MDDLKPGKRYPLLLYTRLLRMYRWAAFWLAVFFFIIAWIARGEKVPYLPPAAEPWALLGGAVSAAFFVFTLYGRYVAYTQCHPTHLRIQTAIFRMNVSYSRISEVRPVDFNQLFAPSRQPWSQRRYLEELFGKTGVGLTLTAFPMDEGLLRLFFNSYMFLPDRTGFLLLAKDWMDLSAQIGHYRELYLARRVEAKRPVRAGPNPFAK